ncbi:MAG: linalool dehydratase/isomerase domain-containing protein [Candidatus Kariarchaeaceae archaeon]
MDWNLFYKPNQERKNFGTRYHLVYPAFTYFLLISKNLNLKSKYKPILDSIYKGLISERVWDYWYTEIKQNTWPIQKGNLTFNGRLATFLGFYFMIYKKFPEEKMFIDSREFTYSQLSQILWDQMNNSECHGVCCFDNKMMVPCNAHLLINNILHDRFFRTTYSRNNNRWIDTLEGSLLTKNLKGPLFYYGTKPNSCEPRQESQSLGFDAWSLFLMSGIYPKKVKEWFAKWKGNIKSRGKEAIVNISKDEEKAEVSSTLLATAWSYCLTKEIGEFEYAEKLRHFLVQNERNGFEVDPLLTGLVTLGDILEKGDFNKFIMGP